MNKRRLKQVLYGTEMRLTGIIANGLVHKTPKAVIFRNMKKEILHVSWYLSLEEAEKNEIWVNAVSLYGKISKETFRDMRVSERKFGKKEQYQEYLSFRKDAVYDAVHKQLENLEKVKNSVADTVEYRVKNSEFKEILDSNSVFYICNWFSDCAKDHIPYQGKVYVNDDWKEIADQDEVARIERYIRKNQVLTVREVMQEKPWLVTRRNCRHRLYAVSVKEVLGSSTKQILKKHDLRRKHENEYNMVLTPEKLSYIKYYERLKAITYLNKLFSCEKLKEDISETRKLMIKWKNKTQNLK